MVSPLPLPDDFDRYWNVVRAEADACTVTPQVRDWSPGGEAAPAGVRMSRLGFRSVGDTPVGGILAEPADPPELHRDRRLPALLHFAGYGGELILHQDLVAAGFVVLDFSHRGMKWGVEGFDRDRPRPLLTRDVEDPTRYVYRAIYQDCLLALRVLRELPQVDPARVGVLGTSQGGALAVGIAALTGVRAAASDLPWLTHFAWALEQPVEGPHNELKDLLAARPDIETPARRTLAYFDTTSLATRLRAPLLVSLGQMDATCPPETVRVLFQRVPEGTCKALIEVPGLGHSRSALWRRLALEWMRVWV